VKKRVLFVDDDALMLKGLQRMLRSLRQQWDMEFVDSGAAALARMGEAQFDVLVTDMRMPGMNGSELLTEVVKRHPQTVRIVLSGHADRELILQCVNSTHQFLSKPCDSDSLKSTIQRACAIENSVESDSLKQLVTRMTLLPSLSSLYMEIVEKLNEPETTIEDIGAIIIKDLGMTAQIMKLVNSAYFGLSQPVSSPSEAAMYLGIDTIKSLVLSIHAFSQFEDVTGHGFDLSALVQHSMSTGARAKRLAEDRDASRKLCDECFIAGLLHDAGKLVLAANCPGDYERVKRLMRTDDLSGCAAEKKIFGADHAAVGGYLLGLWGLPVPVVEAIALHHLPHLDTRSEFSALTAVHVANALEHERIEPLEPAPDAELDDDYLAALGLTEQVALWRENDHTIEFQNAHL
jgi:HD-like signal output (HDOD) protein